MYMWETNAQNSLIREELQLKALQQAHEKFYKKVDYRGLTLSHQRGCGTEKQNASVS